MCEPPPPKKRFLPFLIIFGQNQWPLTYNILVIFWDKYIKRYSFQRARQWGRRSCYQFSSTSILKFWLFTLRGLFHTTLKILKSEYAHAIPRLMRFNLMYDCWGLDYALKWIANFNSSASYFDTDFSRYLFESRDSGASIDAENLKTGWDSRI